MSSYKLVHFLKIYKNTQRIETPIIICLRTAQRWFRKLGYKYKDICKDVFIDENERSDVVEDCNNFLKKMEKLKLYMIEFEWDGKIKAKIYLSDYAIRGLNQWPIMVITHDECTFFINNSI